MSYRTAQVLSSLIKEQKLPLNVHFERGEVVSSEYGTTVNLPSGIRITVLSPTRKELQQLNKYWANESKQYSPDEGPRRREKAPAPTKLGGILLLHSRSDAKWVGRFEGHSSFLDMKEESTVLPLDAVSDYSSSGMRDFRDSIGQFDRILILVSHHTVAEKMLQQVLMQMTKGGLPIPLTWVLLEPCQWQKTLLAKYEAAYNVERPLNSLTSTECEEVIGRILQADMNPAPVPASEEGGSLEIGIPDVEALARKKFKEDFSYANAASIAFLAEFNDRSLLVGGDAIDSVLSPSIRRLLQQRGQKRLRLDGFVVSHAGSAFNVGPELLGLLDCERYLISTSGALHKLPNRETIARILVHGRASPDRPITLVFNYRSQFTAIWDNPELKNRYRYETIYPTAPDAGVRVHL